MKPDEDRIEREDKDSPRQDITVPSDKEKERQLELISQDKLTVFDEMNIVETPFSLLCSDTKNIQSFKFSEDEVLVAEQGGSLPNFLADRAILGLMWMSSEQNRFTSPVIRFELRSLICNYMFRERAYRPGKNTLQAVEEQINRVAFTRLVTNNWWDKELGKRTRMNAAIIDYVQVIEEGGKNRARVLEIRWGEKFYKSLKEAYTKPLDAEICRQIQHPLDLRLYRWLDRQLHGDKRQQAVHSIQAFNRKKIMLTGQKIDSGGRRASTYIAGKLSESLKRLDGVGFSVEMAVDSKQDDFSLLFIKLGEAGPNKIVVEDQPGDLVREFYQLAHGKGRRRLSKSDRDRAQQWIEFYGYDQASWMVKRCVELQKEMGNQPIMVFAGLDYYEKRAVGDYENFKNKLSVQLKLKFEAQLEQHWENYVVAVVRKYTDSLTPQEDEAILGEAVALTDEHQNGFPLSDATRAKVVQSAVRTVKLERAGAMSEEEFKGFGNKKALLKAITERHGESLI